MAIEIKVLSELAKAGDKLGAKAATESLLRGGLDYLAKMHNNK